MHNVTHWRLLVHTMKQRIDNGSVSLTNGFSQYLRQSSIKKYNCEELTGSYLQKVYKIQVVDLHLEERDEQMSKYIHKLLQRSKTDRYFFAIGAGRRKKTN